MMHGGFHEHAAREYAGLRLVFVCGLHAATDGAGERSAPAIIRESGRQMGTLAALRAAIRLFQIWRIEERLHSLRRSVDQHGSQHTAPLVLAQAEASQGAQAAEPWLFGASPGSGARRPRWWSWMLSIAV